MCLLVKNPRLMLGLVLLLLAGVTTAARAEGKKPLTVRVLVPAEAVLEVNGVRLKTRGAVRKFETPPLPPGKDFVYTFEATLHGKTILRELVVGHGRTNVLDLRKAWEKPVPRVEAPSPPPVIRTAGSFALMLATSITMQPGREKELDVTLHRDHFRAPVEVRLTEAPSGVSADPVTIATGTSTAHLRLKVDRDTAPGVHTLHIEAKGDRLKREATVKLTIEKPKPKPVIEKPKPVPPPMIEKPKSMPKPIVEKPAPSPVIEKPKPKPVPVIEKPKPVPPPVIEKPVTPPAPRLTLDVPTTLEMRAGSKKPLHVVLHREHFEGSVDVHVKDLPKGVLITGTAIAADQDAADLEVIAAKNAQGTHTIEVVAQGSKASATARFTLVVEALAAAKPLAPAANGLELQVPERITLRPGRVRQVEVTVKPKGESFANEKPNVTLEVPAGSKLSQEVWSIASNAAHTVFTKVFVLRAAADAAPGKYTLTVRARAGTRQAQGRIVVEVEKPAAAGNK